MKLARVILPGAVIGALLLTGCSGGPSSPAEDTAGEACLASGPASDAVEVTGDFGAADIELASETPLRADESQRTVITEGTGDVIGDGDTMTLTVTMFNGATGAVINSIPDVETTYSAVSLSSDPVLGDVLRCANEGQRAAAVVPVSKVLDGQAPEDVGLTDMTDEDAIVVVMDMQTIVRGDGAAAEEAVAEQACEELTPRDEKFPEIDLGDGKAEPTITIPECMEPPAELEIEVLKEGDGPVVEENQRVMTNYVGVDWNGAVRFDGNWSETGIEFSTAPGALIEGFTQAMVGQKIGSTVLVTMPPELGYKDGMTRTFVLQLVSLVE